MYYIHEKELICPKCTSKFSVTWKEWLEFLITSDQEPYWFKCSSCKYGFGDEKRIMEGKKNQKIIIPIVVVLLLVILILLGYLIYLMYFK